MIENEFKFKSGDRVVINRSSNRLHGRSAIVIACGKYASTIVVDSGPKASLLNRHLEKEV